MARSAMPGWDGPEVSFTFTTHSIALAFAERQLISHNAWPAHLFQLVYPGRSTRELSASSRFDLVRGSNADFPMANELTEDQLIRSGGAPLKVAIGVAILGVLGILIVDHGPWNKPKVQHPTIANYSTTGEAARAAGAQVMPTEPKLEVEPEPPVPKPVHPANRAAQ
jgi:hypothetical protein